jgi:hypothetical protein
MVATLEGVNGKLDHLITVTEVTAARVRRLEDGHVETARVEASMRGIAMRLSATSMAIGAARVASAVALPARSLAVMAAGSFGGGFVGSILWQLLHSHTAMAGVLP